MQTGKIGVTTDNIFPIIKKFLYSDHEIFLRELISNAVDATQKVKTLSRVGDFKGELGDTTIKVEVDSKKKTIKITDRGIGMTADEVNKYINEIAFSSVNDFLDKYKDQANAIIGHFGLGFYSAFMVAKEVDLITKSYQDGAKGVHWNCKGTPEFTLNEIDKADRGTEIILYLDKESEDFASESKVSELLNKYCKFLPVPIAFGKEQEWKDDKYVDTDKDKVINNPEPAWTKKPSDLKDEDYKSFYRELYPMAEEPLFHIHLNVDYPFNLTGILYFPRIKNNIEIQKNKIQLYSNQVFVTDSVEGIVPEFLTLLHGVLDSPDIPLNVSRSYLQSDSNVKKISSHITKKVADRLSEIFKNDREQFEKKWDDLRLFITYGMLTEEKFYERAEKFALFKTTDGKYFTFEEYQNHIKEKQTDKNKQLIYLYSNNKDEQFTFIEAAKAKGYEVLLLDSHLDSHFVNHLEQKFKDSRFVRVDSDVVEKIIQKDEKIESKLNEDAQQDLVPVFKSQLSGQAHYDVVFEAMPENAQPILITQSEFMRRMKDMAAVGGNQMGFYGDLPDSYNLVVNANHELVQRINTEKDEKLGNEVNSIKEKIKPLKKSLEDLENSIKDKKEEEIPQEEKDRKEDLNKKIQELENKKEEKLKSFGGEHKLVKQLIDLALLSNNMLKGEKLNQFIKRSIDLI